MKHEIDPYSIAYIEMDREIGGCFAYSKDEVALIAREIEPTGEMISVKTYNKLRQHYKIPTYDEYRMGKRTPSKPESSEANQPTQQEQASIEVNRSLPDPLHMKMCSKCGKIIERRLYPKMSDYSWLMKKKCSKTCK